MLSFARTRAFHEWKVKQLAFREFARRENMRTYNRQRGFIINPYTYATGGDPYFSSVISLAHFDDTPGSTGPFADQIAARSPGWTRLGIGPSISGSVYKYGSGGVNNGSVGMTNPHHSDWDFGSGDWTYEIWIQIAAATNPWGNQHTVATKWDGVSGGGSYFPWYLRITPATMYPQTYCSTSGSAYDAYIGQTSTAMTVGPWYHLAVVRNGNNLYLFLDGVSLGSMTGGFSTNALMTNSDAVGIGNNSGGGLYSANAYFDDWRATKGVARYTAGFTPPPAAFPNS